MRHNQLFAALVAALAVCGGPAWAEKHHGNWVREPSAAEFAAAWPEAAKAANTPGRAIVRCHVEDSGDLSDCAVVREDPAGMGFGAAMLGLASMMKRKPPQGGDAREVIIPGDWFEFDTEPDWARLPSADELLAVFPKAAFRRGLSGRATINCIVTVQGAVRDCLTVSESPPGEHFGDAAIALTPQFTMRPARSKGVPVVSSVTIPVNFIMPPGAAPAGSSKTVVPPDLPWIEAPTFADVAAAYPEKARKAKIGGHATLSCRMGEDGRLSHCSVLASEPRGYGFDKAARQLAKLFRYEVATAQDRKATHAVTLQMPFSFAPEMAQGPQPIVGKPTWAHTPSAAELTSAFRGASIERGARAVIGCTVVEGGHVDACRVISEEPAGTGIGQAAIALAPAFRLSTWTAEGLPVVGGRVQIPLRYQLKAETAESN